MTGGAKCPICGRERAERFKPFCSKRCADLDLLRWLKEGYAIPAREEPEDEKDGAPPAPANDEGGT